MKTAINIAIPFVSFILLVAFCAMVLLFASGTMQAAVESGPFWLGWIILTIIMYVYAND